MITFFESEEAKCTFVPNLANQSSIVVSEHFFSPTG